MKPAGYFTRTRAAFFREKSHLASSGKSFLIVTEGEKTEPNYFFLLRKLLQFAPIDVEIIHPDATDPVTLTNKAIELRDARRVSSKNGFKIPYDEVWVIFDMERTHDARRHQAREAGKLAGASGIQFAISNPSFEYWLLLHEEYTTSPFFDCDSVMQRLKKHLINYSKEIKLSVEFIKKLPTAVKHSELCRKHHASSGGDGNPSTHVDVLVRKLNAATRPHLRFDLPQPRLHNNSIK